MSASFGCPRCGSNDIEEINEVIAFYPVTQWNEEGEPTKYGEPSYGNSFRVEEYPYICLACRINGDACSFSEPARLPVTVIRSAARASGSRGQRVSPARTRRRA